MGGRDLGDGGAGLKGDADSTAVSVDSGSGVSATLGVTPAMGEGSRILNSRNDPMHLK